MALDATITLTTLDAAKRYMHIGIDTTGDDRLIDALITQASVMVQNELGYCPVETSYTDEIHSGRGSVWLYLDHLPITAVRQVTDDFDTAMSVSYNGGDAARATVEVTSTGLTLRKSIAGTASSDVVTFASYATITLLAAQVEATTGWTTTTESSWDSYESADLVKAGARDANNRWVALVVPEDCETDYEVYEAEGKLYNGSGWPAGNRNILVDYTAGYASDSKELAVIESATLELVHLLYSLSSKDPALRSEKLGDYAYTTADRIGSVFSATGKESVSNAVRMKLAPLVRTMIWA